MSRAQSREPYHAASSRKHGRSLDRLASRFQRVRSETLALVAPLTPEDAVAQSMPDASPAKWHLAHTTWFFEAFVLGRADNRYEPYHPRYRYLFNSYYDGLGGRIARAERGLLTRPTLEQVRHYRAEIESRVLELILAHPRTELTFFIVLGIEHERQHQELLLTDIKHLLAHNPLRPAYRLSADFDSSTSTSAGASPAARMPPETSFCAFGGETAELGNDGDSGFAFDNERPRHRVFVEPFEIATRLVTCGEYLAFVKDGGYLRPELWLQDGYRRAALEKWFAPLYWEPSPAGGGGLGDPSSTEDSGELFDAGEWHIFTLDGMRSLRLEEPVCHVSYYEADAYARWAGARLPSEFEWELVAATCELNGNFVDSGLLQPAGPLPAGPGQPTEERRVGRVRDPRPMQLFGDTWEWTASAYLPYPGFRPWDGLLGEYNGKFMCNQMVLRGGSCATHQDHIRASYRNFFPPEARWQFSGIRLARTP